MSAEIEIFLHCTPNDKSTSNRKIYVCTADFRLRWLQLRIVHRIIPTNSRLCIYGIRPSDSCDRCPGIRESLLHLFWLCPAVLHFWAQFRRLFGLQNPLSAPGVILGVNLARSRISENQMHICCHICHIVMLYFIREMVYLAMQI